MTMSISERAQIMSVTVELGEGVRNLGFPAVRPPTPAPSALVFEEVLNLIDKAVLLAALDQDGTVGLRFTNRSAERLLATTMGATGAPTLAGRPLQLLPSIEGALRRTLEIMGSSHGPVLDHWVCAGRPLRARVSKLHVGGSELLAAELEAEPMQPREGTAALAEAFQLSMQGARLRLVWRGLGNEDIGLPLGIPAGTVKSRLYRLFRRLGVRTRAQAAVLAADLLARAGPPEARANDDPGPIAGTV